LAGVDELKGEGSDDRIDAYPLVAFHSFIVHGALCGLQLHYLDSPAELETGHSSSVPLIMTPALARRLAIAVLKAADEAENGPAIEKSN
jgi:hypothetical protein